MCYLGTWTLRDYLCAFCHRARKTKLPMSSSRRQESKSCSNHKAPVKPLWSHFLVPPKGILYRTRISSALRSEVFHGGMSLECEYVLRSGIRGSRSTPGACRTEVPRELIIRLCWNVCCSKMVQTTVQWQ